MAQIYINCERYDEAIDELDYLLSLEIIYTPKAMKFFPGIEPLLEMPKYKEMIEKYERP